MNFNPAWWHKIQVKLNEIVNLLKVLGKCTSISKQSIKMKIIGFLAAQHTMKQPLVHTFHEEGREFEKQQLKKDIIRKCYTMTMTY